MAELRAWVRGFRRQPGAAPLSSLVDVLQGAAEAFPESDLTVVATLILAAVVTQQPHLVPQAARVIGRMQLSAASVEAIVSKSALTPASMNLHAAAKVHAARVRLLAALASGVPAEQLVSEDGGVASSSALRLTTLATLAAVRALASSGSGSLLVASCGQWWSLFRRSPAHFNAVVAAVGSSASASALTVPDELLPAVSALLVPAFAALGGAALPDAAALSPVSAALLSAARSSLSRAGVATAGGAAAGASAGEYNVTLWSGGMQAACAAAFVRIAVTAATGAAASPAAGDADGVAAALPAFPAFGPVEVAACGPLLSTFTQAQLETALLPALGRGLRSRDVLLQSLPALLASLPHGAGLVRGGSAAEEAVIGPLVAQASSTKDEARAAAAYAARALGSCLANEALAAASAASSAAGGALDAASACLAPLARLMSAAADVLSKKKATVPAWQSRSGLLALIRYAAAGVSAALAAAAASPASHVVSAAAAKACAGVASEIATAVHPKETQDAAKAAGNIALGELLGLCAAAHAGDGAAAASGAGAGKLSLPADAVACLAKACATSPVGGGVSDGAAEGLLIATCGGSGNAGAIGVCGAEDASTLALAGGIALPAASDSRATAASLPSWGHTSRAACARLLSSAPDAVSALLSLVERTCAAALAAGKKGVGATVNAAYAFAALLRMARAEKEDAAVVAGAAGTSAVCTKLSAMKIAADAAPAAAAGAAAGAAGAKAGAAGAGALAAKKPAAGASAAVKPPPAGAAKAGAASAASSGASAGAGAGAGSGAKVYDGWDALATAGLAHVTLLAPSLVGSANRPAAEVAALAPAVLAVTDALGVALLYHGECLASKTAFSKAYLAAVAADLTGATAGDAFSEDAARVAAAAAFSTGRSPSAIAAAVADAPAAASASASAASPAADSGETSKFKSPVALFGGALTLLTHPLPSVRLAMMAHLRAAYAQAAATVATAAATALPLSQLPLALLHALLDRLLRAHEHALAPCLRSETSAFVDGTWSGVGDGSAVALSVTAAVAAAGNKGRLPLSLEDKDLPALAPQAAAASGGAGAAASAGAVLIVTASGSNAGASSAASAAAIASGLVAPTTGGAGAGGAAAGGAAGGAGAASPGAGAASAASAGGLGPSAGVVAPNAAASLAGVYPSAPAAPLLRGALLAILNAGAGAGAGAESKDTDKAAFRFDAGAALPAALLACSHPALTGAPGRDAARGSQGIAVFEAVLAGSDTGATAAAVAYDPRGRTASSLWRRSLRALAAAWEGAEGAQAAAAASAAAFASRSTVPSSLRATLSSGTAAEALLQSAAVASAVSAHVLGGRWGVLSPLHTQRTSACRALWLLSRGLDDVLPPAALAARLAAGSPCAGARGLVTEVVLPSLARALRAATSAGEGFTHVDLGIWRTASGVACTLGDRRRDDLEADLQVQRIAATPDARAARAGRIGARRGVAAREAGEIAWQSDYQLELAVKREAAAAAEQAAAVVAAAKAKSSGVSSGGKGGFGMDDDDDRPARAAAPKPGAAGAGAGKGGPGGKPGAGGAAGGAGGAELDPAAAKLAEQAAVRRHVQAVYSSAMGCLSALRAIAEGCPAAMQPLVPSLLPSLLPLAGFTPVASAVDITMRAALTALLINTSAAPAAAAKVEAHARARASALAAATTASSASSGAAAAASAGAAAAVEVALPPASLPSHVIADWARALIVLQGDANGTPAAESSLLGLSQTGASGAGTTGMPASSGDATGRTGLTLSPILPLLRRLLAPLSARVIPASPFGGHVFTVTSGNARGTGEVVPGSAATAADGSGTGGTGAGEDGSSRRRALRTGLLPPSALHALLPILRGIIMASVPLPVLQPALAILAAHAALPPAARALLAEGDREGAAGAGTGTGTGAGTALVRGGEGDRDRDGGAEAAAASAGGAILLQVTGEASIAVPLGPALADASGALGAAAAEGDGAGVEVAYPAGFLTAAGAGDARAVGPRAALRAFAGHAAQRAAALSIPASSSSVSSSSSSAASDGELPFYGCGSLEGELLALRCLREAMVACLLHALRVAPRSNPAPDAVLLAIVRGAPAEAGAATTVAVGKSKRKGKGDDDDDEAAAGGAGASDSESEDGSDDDDDDDDGSSDGSGALADASAHLAACGSRALTLSLGEVLPLLSGAGLLSQFPHVRAACLSALDIVLTQQTSSAGLGLTVGAPAAAAAAAPAAGGAGAASASAQAQPLCTLPGVLSLLRSRLWLAAHDGDEDVAAHADMLWTRAGGALDPAAYSPPLLALLAHPVEAVRGAAGVALAHGLSVCPSTADVTLKAIQGVYSAFGSPVARGTASSWRARTGALACIGACASRRAIPVGALLSVLPFLVQHGLPDDNEAARGAALAAGRSLVDGYGASHVKLLLPVLEAFLAAGAASPLAAATEAARDAQREGVVVLLGACAKHLGAGDAKVLTVLKVLTETLNTPSEPVQRAVSQCMAPLCKMIKDAPAAGASVEALLERCLRGDSFAVRRGAAFGLGGAVKGMGLAALKNHNVLGVLEAACADAKAPAAGRQGALLAVECLCESLGMLFEPYVTRVLPLLLKAYGDAEEEVRDAATYAGKAVMSVLTGHGVKLVLPAVLAALSEPAWRSKAAAISMLGNMAYCAPKQLGACLPQIVPRLLASFDEAHPKVQAGARAALSDIGRVIRNPEIAAISSVLLAALADADKTKDALTALANTDFVHAIDAASLALVMPVLRRGLADRATSTKTSAGVIAGNVCSLIADPKDIVPYLPTLLAALRKTVVDAIPDVRAVSARAIGSLLKDVGEEEAPDMLPWLLETMQSESSTVERSGAAQATAEVLVALGEPRMSDLLSQLLPLSSAPKPGAREGFLWLVVFLPSVMGASFSAHIASLLPPVLSALADDTESVRDVAVKAGQNIVRCHARSDAGYLLPPLEAGLFSPSWRIRQASVALVGELLVQVSGGQGHFKATVTAGNTEAYVGEEDDEDAFAEGKGRGGKGHGRRGGGGDAYDDDDDDDDDDSDYVPSDEESSEDESSSDDEEEAAEEKPAPKKGSDAALAAAAAKAAAAARRKADKAAGGKGKSGGADKPKEKKEKKKKDADEGDKSNKRSDRRAAAASLGKRARGDEATGKGGKGGEGASASASSAAAALDETFSAAAMDALSASIVRSLGLETRNRLMAALYMVRCDVSAVVRQAALKVWKDTVQNTPRTLREILPALMRITIAALAAADPAAITSAAAGGGEPGADADASGDGAGAGAGAGAGSPPAFSGTIGTASHLAMDAAAERRLVAGRCLGEVVRKLGDRVLPAIVPILRKGLSSELATTRCGVCLGLAEVVEASTRRQLEGHLADLIPAIRDALCDEAPPVRAAAARAFAVLQRVAGQDALAQVLPSLIAAVDSAGAAAAAAAVSGDEAAGAEAEASMARALAGLQGVVTMRPREILLAVLPQLTAAPLTLPHARALAAVASVASGLLHHHLSSILPPIVAVLSGKEAMPDASGPTKRGHGGADAAAAAGAAPVSKRKQAELAALLQTDSSPAAVAARLASPLAAALGSVTAAVEGGAAVAWAVEELLKYVNDDRDATHRRVGAWLISAFVSGTEADVTSQVPLLLRELVRRLSDPDEHALRGCWEALHAIVNNGAKLPAESLAEHAEFVRGVIAGMVSDARFRKGGIGASSVFVLPGLCLPKGLDALLPIYQRALMHGSVEQREIAAAGIGELVEITTHDALKPFYVKITGPLIRIVADKFPWSVKAAILRTLTLILDKGGVALKPFQPQLQATFAKSLTDATAAVRGLGARALGKLMPLAMRADPLLNELCAGVATALSAGGAGTGILHSMLEAMTLSLFRGGDKVTAPVRSRVLETVLPLLGDDDPSDGEVTRRLAAAAAAAAVRHADAATAASVSERLCLTRAEVSVGAASGAALVTVDPMKDARAAGVTALLRYSPAALLAPAPNGSGTILSALVVPSLLATARDDSATIRQHAAKGMGYALAAAAREPVAAAGGAGAGAAAGGAGAASPAAAAAATNPAAQAADERAPDPADLTPDVCSGIAKAAASVVPAITALLSDGDADVRKRAIDACKRWARYSPRSFLAHAPTVVPVLTAFVTKEGGNMVLRAAAERALLYGTGARYLNTSVPAASAGAVLSANAAGIGAGLFDTTLAAVDTNSSRFLSEFGRRVLAKADPDSDDDEPDAE